MLFRFARNDCEWRPFASLRNKVLSAECTVLSAEFTVLRGVSLSEPQHAVVLSHTLPSPGSPLFFVFPGTSLAEFTSRQLTTDRLW